MNDIVIDNFTFGYPDKPLFKNFSFDVKAGKINVILGASGVGKTTLLNAITGLINYEGKISGLPDKISYIFQNDRLIDAVSVYKNLDLVLKNDYKDKKTRRKLIDETLETLEISDVGKRLPTEISGGQAQRVQIARAFLYPSDLMIIDEPFKGLDVALKTRLINKFLDLWKIDGRTIIMVTHDVYEALLMGDYVSIISGNPVECVYKTEIAQDKSSRRLTDPYLTKFRDEIIEKII